MFIYCRKFLLIFFRCFFKLVLWDNLQVKGFILKEVKILLFMQNGRRLIKFDFLNYKFSFVIGWFYDFG